MRIIGIDPGIRNVGVVVADDEKPLYYSTLTTPEKDLAIVLGVYLRTLASLIKKYRPVVAALEQVVWQGRQRRNMIPLSHFAGAMTGLLVANGIPTYQLTPNQKKIVTRRKGWTEHEKDAYSLTRVIVGASKERLAELAGRLTTG